MINAPPTALLREYEQLKFCINQCEAQLSKLAAEEHTPIGLVAMELATIVRHEKSLHELEQALWQSGTKVPQPAA